MRQLSPKKHIKPCNVGQGRPRFLLLSARDISQTSAKMMASSDVDSRLALLKAPSSVKKLLSVADGIDYVLRFVEAL